MCDFLSGFVRLADGAVIVRDTRSHSETARIAGIAPDTAREWEWLAEDEASLRVRMHPDDQHDGAWYRACILALGATRTRALSRMLEDADWRAWLESGGWLDLSGLTSAEGLTLPRSIGGWLNLSGLKSAAGLTLPQSIGGSLDLMGLTSAEGLTLPRSIGGWLYLSGLKSAAGLTLPQSIGGSLDLRGLTSAAGLTLPRLIGGKLYLSKRVQAQIGERAGTTQ